MKKRVNIYLILIIAVAVIGVASIILINVFSGKEEKKEDNPTTTTKEVVKEYDSDYKVLLKYNYLTVDYEIYLLKDDNLKVFSKEKIFAPCEGQNCLKETGEVSTEEIKLSLSEDAKAKACEVISSLVSNNKEVDLTNIKIDSKKQLVLKGIIENDSDMILLADDIKIVKKTSEIKNNKGQVVFKHSYDNIEDSNNKVIKNIRNHINSIVNKEYQEMTRDSKDLVNEIGVSENLGVNYTLKVESITDSEISISYQVDGGLGGVGWYVKKGYVYSVRDGKVLEYPKGRKDETFANALKEFKKSEIYKNESEALYANYEAVLKTKMFQTGNWYLTDSKVVFLVPGSELGFSEAVAKMVEIEVDKINNY